MHVMHLMEKTMARDHLVANVAEAKANVDRYEAELASSDELQGIMSYARAWHAYLGPDRVWRIAPSKFVGYAENDAASYARSHQERDGRRTERALATWSEAVEPGSATYEDITATVMRLFAKYGRTPNKLFRVNVLRVDPAPTAAGGPDRTPAAKPGFPSRITVDANVCSGRPTIRGMRIRVSDILDMLAGGATRQEVLADYRYLEDADIDAALTYAARTVDHRVVVAA